jgi:hypothetical protein
MDVKIMRSESVDELVRGDDGTFTLPVLDDTPIYSPQPNHHSSHSTVDVRDPLITLISDDGEYFRDGYSIGSHTHISNTLKVILSAMDARKINPRDSIDHIPWIKAVAMAVHWSGGTYACYACLCSVFRHSLLHSMEYAWNRYQPRISHAVLIESLQLSEEEGYVLTNIKQFGEIIVEKDLMWYNALPLRSPERYRMRAYVYSTVNLDETTPANITSILQSYDICISRWQLRKDLIKYRESLTKQQGEC